MITENNYEEYFLLYVDNELTETERQAVETFVQQNPKYAELLDLFQQTKLPDEEVISFTNKEGLFKDAEREIGIDNYEDYFLLYTDNELSESAKEKTELFVLQHPQLQAEFTLLQQTKLSPDAVLFKNKESLYRTERKRRIIPISLGWISSAAAVIVLVLFSWLWKSPTQTQTNTTPIAKTETTISHPSISAKKTDDIIPEKQQPIAEVSVKEKENKSPVAHSEITKTAIAKTTKPEGLKPVIVHAEKKPVISDPEPSSAQIALVSDDVKPVAEAKMAGLKPLEEISPEEMPTETASSVSGENDIAKHAVYKEIDTDDDHTLFVGSLQLNKAKVNGFLKSASRLLGGKVKPTEN